MEESRRRPRIDLGPLGRGLGERRPDDGGEEAEPGGEEPDRVEASVSEHELAEHRPEPEASPQAEAVEAQCLASARLGREVGDHGRRADEQHRLAEAREQAERDEDLDRVGKRVSRDACSCDQRARDDEDSAPLAIADAARDRLRDEDHRAHCADDESDAEAPGPQLVVREDRQHDDEHPDRHAHRQLGEHGEHERLRQDAVGLHPPIQADAVRLAR